jgi:exopolyphosphatase / guanosine-5'-triphosphate,3'-diphosphate pyrophosphatase
MTNHAAIDIGTNSVHLLVAEVGQDGEFTVLTTDKETVRLGDGPGDIRLLSEDAISRGVAALRRFAAIADSFDATIYAVATSAVRESDNGHVFVELAAQAGVTVDVISGPEEARLIHLGVLQALPVFDQQLLLVDIGGGSTEFLIGKSGRSLGARSLRIGHLRLTNRFFPGGVITAESVAACRVYTRSFIVPAVNALKRLGYQTAIGSSGTAEALGDMIRLRSHGESVGAGLDTVITDDGLDALIDELVQWSTPEERADEVAGLAVKRADVIVGGAILLDEIFRAFEIDRMITSPFALREGVLLDRTLGIETGSLRLSDLRRDSLMRMVEDFEEDQPHVLHATKLALDLFDQLSDLHGLAPADRELLEAAGLLHNVGLFVSHAAHHQHSEYIIRNSDRLTGYTEREIAVVAQVARYHRRSAPKKSHNRFMALAKADQNRVRWLAGMLRIAIALDRTRSSIVTSVSIDSTEDALTVVAHVAAGQDATVETFTANGRSSLLGSIARRGVTITVEEEASHG